MLGFKSVIFIWGMYNIQLPNTMSKQRC